MADSEPKSSKTGTLQKSSSSGTERCSLTTCTQGHFDNNQSRVEICTALPSKDKYRKIKSKLLVSWNKNGEAAFHPECWDLVVRAAKSRGTRKNEKMKLLDAEKTMVNEGEETAERHDSKDLIKEKAKLVSELIKSSKHCVCFTGAGISTSAGIGDYRGKSGKWTLQERAGVDVDKMVSQQDLEFSPSPSKRRRFSTQESVEDDVEEDGEGVPYEKLRPTYTHEALVKLIELGFLQYVISQNGDGLHTLSGVPMAKISELHGNVFMEKCEKCKQPYERPYYVMDDVASQYYEELEDCGKTGVNKPAHAIKCKLCGLCHRTGRRCEQQGCNGYLMDTIINFRDNLEDEIYERAYDNAKRNDLMLCLGTTMTVTPANELVELGKRPIRLVICNRQSTHLDNLCDKTERRKNSKALGCRVFGDCDFLMSEVMKHLLPPKDLEAWENGRAERMDTYNQKRQ